MQTPHFFPLGEGLELTEMERQEDQLVLHVMATSRSARCPLCNQPATRLHSRYRRLVKDLPCTGQQVQLILHVRKFFCDTVECVRKVFAERLPQLVAPWAQMTTRLNQALQTIGLATCGRLGARLAAHLGITTSWMTIVRRVMALPTPPVDHVECLGLDDFAFRRGRTFGTVVVDLDAHQIIDLLPDRQAETAATWMGKHPEITHVSRDRGTEYASASSTGAPQAIQVADRFHVCKNLSEAVQRLLARVLVSDESSKPRRKRENKHPERTLCLRGRMASRPRSTGCADHCHPTRRARCALSAGCSLARARSFDERDCLPAWHQPTNGAEASLRVVWPLIPDPGASGRATLILTLPTCSNAGTMGSAMAPGSSRKLPRHPLPRLTTHGLSLPENPQEDGGENLCGNPSGAPLHLNSRGVPLHAAPREPGDQPAEWIWRHFARLIQPWRQRIA